MGEREYVSLSRRGREIPRSRVSAMSIPCSYASRSWTRCMKVRRLSNPVSKQAVRHSRSSMRLTAGVPCSFSEPSSGSIELLKGQ